MAYPSAAKILQLAEPPPAGLGIEPIRLFAFAAKYVRPPTSPAEIDALDALVGTWAKNVGVNPAFGYAYMEAYGDLPATREAFQAFQGRPEINYAQTKSKTWAALSAQFAGLGYPPAGGTTAAPASSGGTPTVPAIADGNLSLSGITSWVQANKVPAAIGGGAALLLLLRRK